LLTVEFYMTLLQFLSICQLNLLLAVMFILDVVDLDDHLVFSLCSTWTCHGE